MNLNFPDLWKGTDWAVPCPVCAAARGRMCTRVSAPGRVHVARQRKAKELKIVQDRTAAAVTEGVRRKAEREAVAARAEQARQARADVSAALRTQGGRRDGARLERRNAAEATARADMQSGIPHKGERRDIPKSVILRTGSPPRH